MSVLEDLEIDGDDSILIIDDVGNQLKRCERSLNLDRLSVHSDDNILLCRRIDNTGFVNWFNSSVVYVLSTINNDFSTILQV